MMKKAVLPVAVFTILNCLAHAQAPTAAPSGQAAAFTLKQVGKGVYATISGRAGGNTGFIVGEDAVLVVDTFISQAPARDLLAEIRKVTNLPVKFVLNTHYHLDHVAGNAVFTDPAVGATVIAHRNERGWVRTENLKFYQQNGATPTAEQRALVAALVEPRITFDREIEIDLGSRTVRVFYMPGHTGGDAVVCVPDANVVFTGDLGWNQRIPNLIDGTTSAWIDSLGKLAANYPAATFVPGHGDLARAQDLTAFREYLQALRASIQKAQAAGQSGDGLTQSVLAVLKPKYGSWPSFDRLGPLNVQQTAAEIGGSKRVPPIQPE